MFVPSLVDDLRLRPGPRSVLSHLSRRAGRDNRAWPSVASIADFCVMDEDTVWKSLRELEERGLIRRESKKGSTSVYELLPPSSWIAVSKAQPTRKHRVPPRHRVPGEVGCPPPEEMGRGSPEATGCHLPENAGYEGIPLKVVLEGNPAKGESTPAPSVSIFVSTPIPHRSSDPVPFPYESMLDLPDAETYWRGLRYELMVSDAYLFRAFKTIAGKKLRFKAQDRYTRGQWPLVLRAEVVDFRNKPSTAPGEDECEAHAYGFYGEKDPNGDLAKLRATGAEVPSHAEHLIGKSGVRELQETLARSESEAALRLAASSEAQMRATITKWEDVPEHVLAYWREFVARVGLAETGAEGRRAEVKQMVVAALNAGVSADEVAAAISAHSLIALQRVCGRLAIAG